MKSPQNHQIIQIDITNACTHACSNCTRFCGHHKKPFMMGFEAFKKAVDSLVDFPGMVGIMGGEPTLHPEFERFVEYYASKIGPPERSRRALEPIRDFSEYRAVELSDKYQRRGLWTSLGKGYYKHFELIQEVFDYQCINDHVNPGLHQALLVSRREMGIPDEEWIPLRDRCWIQNLWSSSVTPKGAFFCEVAGALDMLFNGPGGWDIDSEWWKRSPDQFGEQLNWCELCGAALQSPRRQANEEVDDVSPSLIKKLEEVDSPKLRQKRVVEIKGKQVALAPLNDEPAMEWYLPGGDNRQRISGTNRSLYPHQLIPFEFSERSELAAQVLALSLRPGSSNDWLLGIKRGLTLNRALEKISMESVLNPGCLYWQNGGAAGSLAGTATDDPLFVLVHPGARALKHLSEGSDLFAGWEAHKIIELNQWYQRSREPDLLTVESELVARQLVAQWDTLTRLGEPVVLFGAGQHTRWLLELIKRAALPAPGAILDDHGQGDLAGVPIKKPEEIERPAAVMISANTDRVAELLKRRCVECWGEGVLIVDPYAHLPRRTYRKVIPDAL